MPPEKSATALNWLRRAKSNLLLAQTTKPEEVFWEDLCFDAQQCVEKSLKALLIFYNIRYPHTHSISVLLKTLQENRISFPEEFFQASFLTDYAVESRYPGNLELATQKDLEKALEHAQAIFNWVQQEIDKQLKLGL
jgi:HEPN domain-containing protein